MPTEDAVMTAGAWEQQRARLLALIEDIRRSRAGPHVESNLRGIERVMHRLERELGG